MPTIYLSPSTQPYNLYVTGGNEQEWMNLLADHMEPYLNAAGIQYVRKTLNMTAGDAIRQSNAGNYDLHLGLHSNAAPPQLSGQLRGILVFYYPGSAQGLEAATIIADGLKAIYPLPELVRTEPTTSIGEVANVRAPAAFLEIGYHDNVEDALWVQENLDPIARNVVNSLSRYFGLPVMPPTAPVQGVVDVSFGVLNIREAPSTSAPIIATATDGAPLTILGSANGWDFVQFGNVTGYANADYITPA